MAEGEVGAVAPAANETNAPGAQPVSAPVAPVGGNEAAVEKPVAKTYTDDDVKKVVSDRLTKERRRIERTVRAEVERDYYRNLAENPRQQQLAQDKPKGKPLAKDFADVDSYIDAVTDWKLEQREAKQRDEAQRREPEQRQAQSAMEYSRSLQERLAPGDDDDGLEDFEDVVMSDDVPFTDPMVAAIHESDIPRKLAYHLATHLTELKRIAKLPATRQVVEIGKIEDKLKAPPKQSAAPPPIVPNGGANAGNKKDWSHMSTEEHVRAYRNRDKR